MNQAKLIAELSNRAALTQSQASLVLRKIGEIAIESLGKGEDVSLVGLGKLSLVEAKARVARNPKTGEKIDVPAKRKATFSASKGLKEALNT